MEGGNKKVCGPRPTKNRPAYLKSELVEECLSQGLIKNKTEGNRSSMEKLCSLLGLDDGSGDEEKKKDKKRDKKRDDSDEEEDEDEKVEDEEDKEEEYIKPKKECGPIKSKNHPNVYSKIELVELAMKKKGLTRSKGDRMTKEQLCELLFGGVIKNNMPDKFSGRCSDYDLDSLRYLLELEGKSTEGKRSKLCRRLKGEDTDDEEDEDQPGSRKKKKEKEKEKEKKKGDKKGSRKASGNKGKGKNKGKSKEKLLALKDMPEYQPVEIKEHLDEKELEELDEFPSCAISKTLPLREHQMNVVRHMMTHRGLLAIHQTGSGKTATAVAAMECILKNYPDVDAIFIAPVSLIENFKKEIVKFGLDPKDPIYGLGKNANSKKARVKYFSKDKFYNDYNEDQKMNICKRNFLIIDEAHNFKARYKPNNKKPGGLMANTVIRCASKAFKVLLLSATPVTNRPSDIINLISMIDGTPAKNASYEKYFDEVIMEDDNLFNKYFGGKISVNMVPKDHCYPTVREHIKMFTMSPDYYKDYYDIQVANEENFPVDRFGDPKSASMFYNAIRRASLSLYNEKSPKVQWTFEKLVEQYELGKKSIAFSAWLEAGIKQLARLLARAKIPYGIISGQITAEERERFKKEFNSGKLKILLLTKAGGEGLDLVECSNVIIMESNWNAAADEQIIGRAVRYKSHERCSPKSRKVDVYKLMLMKPPKEERFEEDELESVDKLLSDLSYVKKKPLIEQMLERLNKVSIESKL